MAAETKWLPEPGSLGELEEHVAEVLGPAWEDIRHYHPDLPAVVFDLDYSDHPVYASAHRPGSKTYESLAGQVGRHWFPELTVSVGPECLRAPAMEVVNTLLHEACHVLDFVRTGAMSGHGDQFRTLAAEVGLKQRDRSADELRHMAETASARSAASLARWGLLRAEAEMAEEAKTELDSWCWGVGEGVLTDRARAQYEISAASLAVRLAPWQSGLKAWHPITEQEIEAAYGVPPRDASQPRSRPVRRATPPPLRCDCPRIVKPDGRLKVWHREDCHAGSQAAE